MGGKPSIAVAWETAVALCAATWGVTPDAIAAESRGRGPRPPEAVREPKKVAIYLAVTLADCQYTQLATVIGLHKDTVASHCDDIRNRCADDVEFEEQVEALVASARTRAKARVAARIALRAPDPTAAAHEALRAFADELFDAMRSASSVSSVQDGQSRIREHKSPVRRVAA